MTSNICRLGCLERVGLVTLLVGWVLTLGSGLDRTEGASVEAAYGDIAAVTSEANISLGVEASTVVTLGIAQAPGRPVITIVPIDGEVYTLELVPHSVRSDSYRVQVQLADGSYHDVEPGPIRTLRGTVKEVDGAVVGASLSDEGLHARIIFPDDTEYWVEPLVSRVAAAAPGQHAVFRGDDVTPSGGTCRILYPPISEEQVSDGQGAVAAGGLFVAELAIDADYEYFLEFGNLEDTMASIEGIINAINVQYERDVGITHILSTIKVRASEAEDPYSETDAEFLLYEFRDHWLLEHSDDTRDIAQLFTGKELDGNTIGIAWLGTVCDHPGFGYGYSVVQPTCCDNFACKTDLSAHELGHSWSALHCGDEGVGDPDDCDPPCPNHTMNCYLTCKNQFDEMITVPDIIAFRDSRSCLEVGDELNGIIVSADSDNVLEGAALQFTATADFRYGQDQDVTSEAIWSVDRPQAGSIGSDGWFTAFDVGGDVCVTVSASFTFDSITRMDDKIVAVTDPATPLASVASIPPDGAIDARQPCRPDGTNPAGWQSFDIVFNGETCLTTAADFAVAQAGGVLAAPTVVALEHVGPQTVRVLLSDMIEPGAWTTVTHLSSGVVTRVGYLPGDVNSDETSAPADILRLVDALNGVGDPRAIWSIDVDHSGVPTPADILRVIDLLNGAGVYQAWLNRSLP